MRFNPKHPRDRLNKFISFEHKIIPFKQGRPKREKIINNDDRLNLIILLNSCKCLDEFLNKI